MSGYAWVTLATNDSYSLGALVLAHSLKQVGTQHQLVVLVTPGVTNSMRQKLSSVFNAVHEVNTLDSRDEANLRLLKRPELGITFTKLHCWRLVQYEKCVFLDADTLVLSNCDELLEREELSAAPDVGWPDCFNSGVFVYRPSNDTYNKLVDFALQKGSFDGGDQGLLNLYFSDWAHKDISKHLPFIYNMCSTATYSYLPAFKQYGKDAKIVHFIGPAKPWLQYFDTENCQVHPSQDLQHLGDVLQRWWNIFCSVIHPNLSPDMSGLAGAFAQFTLGAKRSASQDALENHLRRQAWETGNVDYLGRDSFDNIWSKICESVYTEPPPAEKQEAQSATGEVTSTINVQEFPVASEESKAKPVATESIKVEQIAKAEDTSASVQETIELAKTEEETSKNDNLPGEVKIEEAKLTETTPEEKIKVESPVDVQQIKEPAKGEEQTLIAEKSPTETKSEEIKLEETKSEETKPEETKPEETKAEETKPEETKPEETKPEETKPGETKSEEKKSEETKSEDKMKTEEMLKSEETKTETTPPTETSKQVEKTDSDETQLSSLATQKQIEITEKPKLSEPAEETSKSTEESQKLTEETLKVSEETLKPTEQPKQEEPQKVEVESPKEPSEPKVEETPNVARAPVEQLPKAESAESEEVTKKEESKQEEAAGEQSEVKKKVVKKTKKAPPKEESTTSSEHGGEDVPTPPPRKTTSSGAKKVAKPKK